MHGEEALNSGGPAVTFAVVSWNTRELLERCLRSLEGDARTGRVVVWVVDNASHDGSADMVDERFGWATLIRADENLGFGRAVNLVGERAPRTPWLVAANADIALEPGALDALLAAGDADPEAGALAPRLLLPDGSTQHSVHPFPDLPTTLAFNAGLHRVIPGLAERLLVEGSWDAERAQRVPWALGALVMVRRDAWDAVGGFDERQWMYAEDLDLAWRLARAGGPTRYVPEARVLHEGAASASQAFGERGDQALRWQRVSYAWMLRRRGWMRTRLTALANVIGAGVRWAFARGARRAMAALWVRAHLQGLRSAAWLERQR